MMFWVNVGMAQTKWEKYPGNPVLGDALSENTVLFDGTEYKTWYVVKEGISYATSPDGISWVKYPDNPVLGPGEPWTWNWYGIHAPTVLFDGTEYKMWYGGGEYGSNYRIGYATSDDGVSWVKYAGNPVLDLGTPGTWDDYYVHSPTVLFNGTKYQMWYTGRGEDTRIGYATSIPGTTGSINGTVTDMVGFPLLSLVIAIKKPIKKGTLSKPPDGYYEITDLEPGDYLVLAIKKRYRAGFARVTVEAGRTTTQDFQLRPKSGEDDEDDFTDLYANYPNPFNPDTWIPYYLPQDADVTIQIYNSAGQLVRTLNFGRKAAGIYLDKDKAAYWDGCDSLGEKVASGVYYYTLQAGEFRATRKMLIVK